MNLDYFKQQLEELGFKEEALDDDMNFWSIELGSFAVSVTIGDGERYLTLVGWDNDAIDFSSHAEIEDVKELVKLAKRFNGYMPIRKLTISEFLKS